MLECYNGPIDSECSNSLTAVEYFMFLIYCMLVMMDCFVLAFIIVNIVFLIVYSILYYVMLLNMFMCGKKCML